MIQIENNTDITEKIVTILHRLSEHLQGFTQELTEIREFMKKATGDISPPLLDKEALCRKLNIAERIKAYNIPVHKLGSRLYFYWEEVEQSLKREKV